MSNPNSTSEPVWQNWSGNIVYTPPDGSVFTPANVAELQGILAQAAKAGVWVRVSGQRHSQPPLVTRDNRNAANLPATVYLVDMSCYADLGPSQMDRMVLGPGVNQVTVNPGVREDDLDAFLMNHNLMLSTVTAGGFFSLGGMTAVDVHGGTVEAPIFAETATAFTIMDADGKMSTIDRQSPPVGGLLPLQFARVSLGALGIVTSITLEVLPRPWATTLQGNQKRYLLADQKAFVAKFKELLTAPGGHTRVESFYTPYAAASNVPFVHLPNFLVLWWDTVQHPHPETPNGAQDPKTACTFAHEGKYGAPVLDGIASYAVKYVRESQYFSDAYDPFHIPPVPPSGYTAIALDEIEKQVAQANKNNSDLWLSTAASVIFMSYYIELPNLDDVGLGRSWQGLAAAGDYVIKAGNFDISAPLEFRFVKGGNSAMSGAFSTNPDAYFVNLDLIGWVEKDQPASQYPAELLKFFAHVERMWVAMGGLPHNGKMYGFYDPNDGSLDYFTPPFNKNFLKFITRRRRQLRQAPVDAFRKYRASRDPAGRFYNQYLRDVLED